MSDENKEKQGKRCFIITPIGDAGSDIFRKAKGVIDSVIKPVLSRYGFTDIKPAYEILESGMIGNQIIDRIVNDDLVVANLTGNNPNVMYELAIRHATAKPIIHICERATVLPFDIKDNRTSFYKDDMLGVQELQKEFENYVSGINYCREYRDNPIYSGIEMATILNQMDSDGRRTEAEILQKILDEVSHKPEVRIATTNRITRVYQSSMLQSTDFILGFDEINVARKEDFLKRLENELLEKDVIYLGQSGVVYCWENAGNAEYSEIKQIVDEISQKYGMKITFLKMPEKY